MKNIIYFVLISAFFTACTSKNELSIFNLKEKQESYFSTKKAKKVRFDDLVNEIKEYQIVFVGDHHNTKKTHEFLNKVLKKLAEDGFSLKLANEWFSPKDNELLASFVNQEISSKELKEKRQWEKFTKYKWELVESLYKTIQNSKGELYGININKENRKKISLKEFSQMSVNERIFYDNLDLNVLVHKNLVKPYFKHCNKMPIKSDEPCEDRMYRVQVAWDTYMAEQTNLLVNKVLKKEKDILLVFAGAMHVEKNLGIPLRFSRLNNKPYITLSNYKIKKDKDISFEINKADLLYLYE